MRNFFSTFAFLTSFVFLSLISTAQRSTLIQIAGGGVGGGSDSIGDGLPATNAIFNIPTGITSDSSGNIFIADAFHARIRKIDALSGVITCVAGTSNHGFSGDSSLAVLAKLQFGLKGICLDRFGNIFFVDAGSHRIRKIENSTGKIYTLVGNDSLTALGDSLRADSAYLSMPNSVFVDDSGNVFLTDSCRIRKVCFNTGIITTIAGTGAKGFSGDGGLATAAKLNFPFGVIADRIGNVYFTDKFNNCVRKIDTSGVITTVAGKHDTGTINSWFDYRPGTQFFAGDGGVAVAAQLKHPGGIGMDTSGNIYFTDNDNTIIRKVVTGTGIITTVAGTDKRDTSAFYDGKSSDSVILNANFIYVNNNGSIFYTDTANNIRKINNPVSGIRSAKVLDTLMSTPCTLSDTVAMGVYGTISGVPDSTDSLNVQVIFGDGTADTVIRIPYWVSVDTLGDTTHGFGTVGFGLCQHIYSSPGIYSPMFKITALGGYNTHLIAPAVTVGTLCDTLVKGIKMTIAKDTITTGPCVCPIVRFNISGRISGNPTPVDSVWLTINFGDGTIETHILRDTLIDTLYCFNFIGTHTYTPGNYTPKILAVSSTGTFSDYCNNDSLALYIDYCGCGSGGGGIYGSITSHIVENVSAPDVVCSLPFLENYTITGKLIGMAAMPDSVTSSVNFGDGSDTIIKSKITTTGHGDYHYVIDTLHHSYSFPGGFATSVLSTSSFFSAGSSTGLRTYGNSCAPVSGSFYLDANGNCVPDTGEVGLGYWGFAVINNTLGDTTYKWCDNTGHYSLNLIDSDSYTIIANHLGYFWSMGDSVTPSCPASGIYTIMPTSGSTVVQNFAFSCVPPASLDMFVSGWGWGFIPGDTGIISIWSGDSWGYICDSLWSTVTLTLDTNLTYAGMWDGAAPTIIAGNTLSWVFSTDSNLFEFFADVKVKCSNAVSLGDSVRNRLHVSPSVLADLDTTNNTYSWSEPVQSSWDPNEKQVSPKGLGTEGYIDNGTTLSYLVHFTNTGTTNAINIAINDTINSNLNIGTLQILNASATVQVYQVATNVVKFMFNNINLPDSTTNPLGSTGYVSFSIEPFPNLAPLTSITNRAGIYFDYNPVVITGTTTNTIKDTLAKIVGSSIVCIGTRDTLSNATTGGVWSISNTNAAIDTNGVLTGVTSGSDTVTYTRAFLWGTYFKTLVITVNPAPTAGIISGADSMCIGETITLTDTVLEGIWTNLNSSIATITAFSDTAILTGVAAGVDSVIYSLSNICGHFSIAKLVTVNAAPNAGIIIGNSTVCKGSQLTLTDSIVGGTWSTTDATRATVSSAGVVSGIQAGADTINYTNSNLCGTNVASKIIIVHSLPNIPPITGGTGNICYGFVDTFHTPYYGGSWSLTNNHCKILWISSDTCIVKGTTNNSFDTLFYIATDSNGCNNFAVKSISVNPIPDVQPVSDFRLCAGDASAQVAFTGSISGTAFNWKNDDTAIGLPANGTGNLPAFIADNSTEDSLVAKIIVTPVAVGCKGDSISFKYTVNPTPVAPAITSATPSGICYNTLYQNFGSGVVPKGVNYTWTATNADVWYVGDGGSYCLVNFNNPGLAKVSLTAGRSGSSCKSTSFYQVSVGNTIAIVPQVIYLHNEFMCLRNDATSYQWGYDDRTTLQPVTIYGENHQNYFPSSTPDFDTKCYWVTTIINDCYQKTYYNSPPAAINQTNELTGTVVFVYPVPSAGSFTVQIPESSKNVVISVSDIYGREITSRHVINSTTNFIGFDLPIPAGNYFIKTEINGVIYRNKLIIYR